MCDQVLIIAGGKLVAFDEPANLEKRLLTPAELLLTTEAGQEEAQKILQGIGTIEELSQKDGYTSIQLGTDRDDIYALSRAVFFAFAGARKALLSMTAKKASLEEVFLELTEQSGPEVPISEEAGVSEGTEGGRSRDCRMET